MIPFSLDIRTVISLLFVGNLIAVGVLAAYKSGEGMQRPFRQFLVGKILQACAWALLSLRGEVPDLLTADLGDAMLFMGFALEVCAVAGIGVIAYNPFMLFKHSTLVANWQRHKVATVRWRLFHLAGKGVGYAGAWVLKVAADVVALFRDIRTKSFIPAQAPAP